MPETVLNTNLHPRRAIIDEHEEHSAVRSGIETLTDIYKFNNPSEILSFLNKAGNLVIEVLKDAPNHITKLFGNVPLHLEVVHDPEENFELLFIDIKTDLPASSAVDLLDMLDDEWWLKVDTNVRKMLAVDV